MCRIKLIKKNNTMDSRVYKSRKRHSGIQDPMIKKVLKTIPHFKENIPEKPSEKTNTSVFTYGLNNVLGVYYLIFNLRNRLINFLIKIFLLLISYFLCIFLSNV